MCRRDHKPVLIDAALPSLVGRADLGQDRLSTPENGPVLGEISFLLREMSCDNTGIGGIGRPRDLQLDRVGVAEYVHVMPDTGPNEFTEREKFVLSFYRDRQLSSSRRLLGYDLIIALASIACVILAVTRDEVAFGLSGYVLLLGRLYYLVVEGGRWTKDFQSIFAKYDAKLKELSEAQKRKESGDDVV